MINVKLKNILSFDLEDWYAPNDILNISQNEKTVSQIEDAIEPVLDLLEKHNLNATFFVSGHVLETNPDLIKKLYALGHEIASHGFSHVSLDNLTIDEFLSEVQKMNSHVKEIIGKSPIGFRAPMFSVNKRTSWAIDVLQSEGYKYDSSIFPYKNRYFGENISNQNPNFFANTKIFEYPIRIIKFLGLPFVATGGFFFRFYPYFLTKILIKSLNKEGQQVIFYAHPREFYTKTNKVQGNIISRFFLYFNISNNLKKLDEMLTDFDFCSFEEDMKRRELI